MRIAWRRRSFVAASVLALGSLFLIWKAYQYAAPPVQPKDCSFVYPPSPDPQPNAKPLTLPAKSALVWSQKGGSVNDASCLNQTAVAGIVEIRSEEDVRAALQFARENGLKVTPAGRRHSMGGQSFVQEGLVLDMQRFNKISGDREKRILRAQSGATWALIEKLLDTQGLSLKAVQSINIFTVGGTLSVNAHGIAHNPGPIASTVRSLRVMTSDGQIHVASPTENAELFRHVLGGYGLFGVILDVELDLVENEIYAWQLGTVSQGDFPRHFAENVARKNNVGLFFARLSMSPNTFLDEVAMHRFEKVAYDDPLPPLHPQRHISVMRLIINFSKTGGLGRWLRWVLETRIAPHLRPCAWLDARGQERACLITRNQAMYDSMAYLQNRLPDTDILQEYFIPHERMDQFVEGMRDVVTRNKANLINVTIRIVHKDEVTALPYAKQDMFAFVLYFNQGLNDAESKITEKTTRDLIDLAARASGTFYLPYQLFYSPEQLRKAYPEVDAFFAAKRKYDPLELFSNKFYEKYGRSEPQRYGRR